MGEVVVYAFLPAEDAADGVLVGVPGRGGPVEVPGAGGGRVRVGGRQRQGQEGGEEEDGEEEREETERCGGHLRGGASQRAPVWAGSFAGGITGWGTMLVGVQVPIRRLREREREKAKLGY